MASTGLGLLWERLGQYRLCFFHPIKHQYLLVFIFMKNFLFIVFVSDTVLDMINAVYHDKPLIFTGLYV